LFKFNGETLFARLVDLPCILETQRTFDRRSFIKVTDVSQMIVIERIPQTTSTSGAAAAGGVSADAISHFFSKPLSTDEFIFNSGLTPPLKHCRVRRFRKRLNKRTLESIEREVARLLKEDQKAERVETQFVDPAELDDRLAAGADEAAAAEDEIVNIEGDYDDDDDYGDDEGGGVRGAHKGDGGGGDSDIDSELAAELEDEIAKAFDTDDEDEDEDEEDEEEEDEIEGEGGDELLMSAQLFEEEEEEDEEEYEDAELRVMIDQQKILREEMRDLDQKIAEKGQQRSRATNAIIQKRFDDILRKLESERELKQSQLTELELSIEDQKQEAEELAAEAKNNAAELDQPPPPKGK
jgi:transcription initiation factor TFIID subunit 7